MSSFKFWLDDLCESSSESLHVQDIASYHLPQPFLIHNVICLKLEHIELLISVHLQHINLEIGLWSFFLKLKLEVQSNDLSPPFNFMLRGVWGGQGEDHGIHSHKTALQHTRHLLNANFSHPLKFLILSNFKSVKKEGIGINTGLTYRFILSSKCTFCPKLMMISFCN